MIGREEEAKPVAEMIVGAQVRERTAEMAVDSTELERLRVVARQKNEQLLDLRKKERDRQWELNEHYNKLIQDTIEREMGADLRAAQAEYTEASSAVDAEKDRLARLGVGAKLPVGTKVVEWRKDSFSTHWSQTGKTGIYELITSDSKHPANGYKAIIGAAVVRHTKKDGTPSLKYEKTYNHTTENPLPYGWFIEGVDPNKTGGGKG